MGLFKKIGGAIKQATKWVGKNAKKIGGTALAVGGAVLTATGVAAPLGAAMTATGAKVLSAASTVKKVATIVKKVGNVLSPAIQSNKMSNISPSASQAAAAITAAQKKFVDSLKSVQQLQKQGAEVTKNAQVNAALKGNGKSEILDLSMYSDVK